MTGSDLGITLEGPLNANLHSGGKNSAPFVRSHVIFTDRFKHNSFANIALPVWFRTVLRTYVLDTV